MEDESRRDWKSLAVEEEEECNIIELIESIEEDWTIQFWQEKDWLTLILYESTEERESESHKEQKNHLVNEDLMNEKVDKKVE